MFLIFGNFFFFAGIEVRFVLTLKHFDVWLLVNAKLAFAKVKGNGVGEERLCVVKILRVALIDVGFQKRHSGFLFGNRCVVFIKNCFYHALSKAKLLLLRVFTLADKPFAHVVIALFTFAVLYNGVAGFLKAQVLLVVGIVINYAHQIVVYICANLVDVNFGGVNVAKFFLNVVGAIHAVCVVFNTVDFINVFLQVRV